MAEKRPESCNRCAFWEKHQDSCWYYWEMKKECSMHSEKQDL